MWVLTFHSACTRMLRVEATRLGYTRQFTIYDQADSRRLVKHSPGRRSDADPKRFTPGRRPVARSPTRRTACATPPSTASMVGSYFEQTVADAYELYERELVRYNAMDFDDLLVRAVNLLELFPEVRERYQQAFRHVLVDEYQDTNHAQYRWLTLLAGERRNLAVVGDDAQSIYGFRGADIRNILDFEQRLPGRPRRQARAELPLDADDPLGRQRGDRAQPQPGAARSCGPRSGEGDPIRIRVLADEHAEARYVLSEIERLVDEGVSRAEIAVFYRTNAQSRVLEDALVRAEVPYQVIGGTKFYERAEIKDAIAYLSLLANPSDQISFTRVANSPRRGHRADLALARDRATAATLGEPVWDVAAAPETRAGLGPAAITRDRALHGHDGGAARAGGRGGPVGELLEAVLRRSGYLDALEAERTFEAQGRIENLEELVGVAREFDASAEAAAGSTPSSRRSRWSATPTRASTTTASSR